MAELDRDRVCSDVLNTSVMAALVGGFVLGNMQPSGSNTLDHVIYLASCLSVHACTCSALTSALMYRVVVRMEDDSVPRWAASHPLLLLLPLAKFGMGCVAYLLSVILISFRDLEESAAFQYACLVIGVMSMSTVFATVAVLAMPEAASRWRPGSRSSAASAAASGSTSRSNKRVAPK